jgi:glycogen operon protein
LGKTASYFLVEKCWPIVKSLMVAEYHPPCLFSYPHYPLYPQVAALPYLDQAESIDPGDSQLLGVREFPDHANRASRTQAAGRLNVALYAPHAEAVLLCCFIEGRERRYRLNAPHNGVWHGSLAHPLSHPQAAFSYGFRVFGPYEPEQGHRFNPHKLLLDPYARQIVGQLRYEPGIYGYARADGSGFSECDSAPLVPKAYYDPRDFDPLLGQLAEKPPQTPWAETLIYEAHIKGLTQQHTGLSAAQRGSYAGLAQPVVIEHITQLGVTAVELLPVQAFVDERHLPPKGLVNHWGYNTLGFFAGMGRYGDPRDSRSPVRQIAALRAALHQARVELILDVVYNHTAEGDHLGPTLSFRGIDNRAYYRLARDRLERYENPTGTGNALNLAEPQVLKLVLDSLRFWAQEVGVDGFRFDLATTLTRRGDGRPAPREGLFAALLQDPLLRQKKCIVEPWDIGEAGYQLGAYPSGVAEWNDAGRDALRRSWNLPSALAPLAETLLGSAPRFERPGRGPDASLNYITSHDGFTLHDLLSYTQKHNAANQEGNRDGHEPNWSANYGVEGPSKDPAIQKARRDSAAALLATLLLCQGIPMLTMGDEIGRSQGGNNNAYAQDNPLSWMDWDASRWPWDLRALLAEAMALRRRFALLRHPLFLHGRAQDAAARPDVTWARLDGRPLTGADWQQQDRAGLSLLLNGQVYGEETLWIALNRSRRAEALRPPARFTRQHWQRVFTSGGTLADRAETLKAIPARRVWVMAEADT